ncbi:MAG: glycosyltransferase family A protein, partial [Planctomycetota bacterium]|nr:glycosyltransferase family A protein [Planctomycetota bacterium]
MIPPRPREPIELAQRHLKVLHDPGQELRASIEVVVGITVHQDLSTLSRCFKSLNAQRDLHVRLGVVLLIDGIHSRSYNDLLSLSLKHPIWLLHANCGSAARSRNTILSYVDDEFPNARWVARMDGDDRFACETSLASAVTLGDQSGAKFVLGGNRVLNSSEVLLRLNHASQALKKPHEVLKILEETAAGTVLNELPSCNLLLRTKTGWRYQDMKSAEDHWLVAELLIHHSEVGSILTEPLYADYTVNGSTTQSARETGIYLGARQALFEAATVWLEAQRLPGEILGWGREGIVRRSKDRVIKHFYPHILKKEKAHWLQEKLSDTEPFIPAANFVEIPGNRWEVTYPWTPSVEPDFIGPEAVQQFLDFSLRHRLVCANIKRANFRRLEDGQLQFIDVGNWIIPMEVSYLRDSAARLYSIGVLAWPDDEVLRRPTDFTKSQIWKTLPGFSDFYRSVIQRHHDQHIRSLQKTIAPSDLRREELTLLIKACGM